MKKIEAIIKPFKLDDLKEAVHNLGIFAAIPVMSTGAHLHSKIPADFA